MIRSVWCPGRGWPSSKARSVRASHAAARHCALHSNTDYSISTLGVAAGVASRAVSARNPRFVPFIPAPLPICGHVQRRAYSDPTPLFRFDKDDTIYALSSAEGRAGIAVIRVSGPACLDIYKGLCPGKPALKLRYAHFRALMDPTSHPSAPEILDSGALVLYFPGPNSVTGEDVLELHTHGGPATVRAVLAAIPRCASQVSSQVSSAPRYASPGEFTRRAFLHSRLDLAQIESLGDALAAETEQQRRAAVRGSSGALGRTYDGWRTDLLAARAELEALIDFAEDQAFDESQADLLIGVAFQVERILAAIRRHEDAGARAELLRRGIVVALVGRPNVGKSSLMNHIVGREASIVSNEAGTTRDVVETRLDIGGFLCTFADTAGIRSETRTESGTGEVSKGIVGAVEEEGIRRAKARAAESDVVIVLMSIESGPGGYSLNYDDETLRLAAAAQASIIVVNKRDTVPDAKIIRVVIDDLRNNTLSKMPELSDAPVIAISCKEAQEMTLLPGDVDPGGIRALSTVLVSIFGSLTSVSAGVQDLLGVTERQRQLLEECWHYLNEFMREARSRPGSQPGQRDADVVLAAEYLRFAAICLARITGRGEGGDVEEVLGVVFERFCVGK